MERRNQANDGGLARAGRADQRRHRSRPGVEGNVVQHGFRLLVGEGHVLERHIAADFRQRDGALRVFVLGSLVQHLARPFQPGDGLGDLRSDADHLEQRRREIAKEHRVGKESAQRELAGENLPRPHEHHDGADDSHQRGGRKAHDRGRGQRPENVLQQALHARAEDLVLALLRRGSPSPRARRPATRSGGRSPRH